MTIYISKILALFVKAFSFFLMFSLFKIQTLTKNQKKKKKTLGIGFIFMKQQNIFLDQKQNTLTSIAIIHLEI